MQVNVNVIAKETILELGKRNLLLTPENYSEVFDEIARKYGRTSQNSEKLQSYIAKLNKNLANDLRGRNVKSIEELLVFLISKANNIKDDNEDKKLLNDYNVICRKLLKEISQLPCKLTSDLSEKSLEKLNYPNAKTIEDIKNSWLDIDLEDSRMQILNIIKRLDIKADYDILEILKGIEDASSDASDGFVCEKLAPSVAYSLTPSIANYINEEISEFCTSIQKEPKLLNGEKIAEQLKYLVEQRIDMDRAEISSSNKVLNEVLEEISAKIANILSMATNSQIKVKEIKKEIEGIKTEDKAMQVVRDRLVAIVASFEKEISTLKENTQRDSEVINTLKVKVQGLELEINKLREEVQVDFLTQLANKRQLEEKLRLAEESYQRYNINYSIAFFDIDHFKSINDTYGHAAGDAILAGLGTIILNHTRKLDCAGRYGGEEFMVILPHTQAEDAIKFAEKIRILVAEQKFLYKGKLISVKISGGVSDRKNYSTKEEFVEAVDKLLYAAKNAGRNNIQSAK